MAINNNQHFVPKTYLHPFGNDDQRSINLYALGSNRCVEGASIKSEWSRDYFYGGEPVFEDFIQYFEGRYGQSFGRLQQRDLLDSDIGVLFDFFVLQYLRTPHQLAQRKQVFEGFRNIVIGGKPLREVHEEAQRPIDDQWEMQEQIYIAAKAGNIPLDFLLTASIGAAAATRLLSSRIPDAGGGSGLLVMGAAVVAALTRRTTHEQYSYNARHFGTRQRRGQSGAHRRSF